MSDTEMALPASSEQATSRGATTATARVNANVLEHLPFSNREDFEEARRGFIAPLPQGTITDAHGRVVWDLTAYQFLTVATAPPTVNPSLWRQAQLNTINGLFQVTEHIYQIRGFDLSNMTLIEGESGLILIDPLISVECAKAGLDLYYAHRPKKPVRAVIYTHSHVDHFGGVKGVVSEQEVQAGNVSILAPEGFLEHAVVENIFAGNAMSRRSHFQYGTFLARGERGQVDCGLGKTASTGTLTLIPPTETIHTTGERRTIEGVDMVFQMANETEAPAEMLMYFPQWRTLCAAEDLTHNMHNLYTLRGAEVRNAAAWWKTLNEAIELFGQNTEIVLAQHHWPMWGHERILTFLAKQRDLYKYLHDQTLRLMNHGYTMLEVGDLLRLPESLAGVWYNRGYYGSVNHNAKAIYQKYLGFYSSNPAELHPLPPEEAAKKYVAFMGGAQAILEKARASFKEADYRWVAQVLNHVVFADPENEPARNLLADALEQLGYQAENGTWRNEYLVGAFELRHGVPRLEGQQSTTSPDMIKAMTLEMYFDFLGICLNGPQAEGKTITLNWDFPDVGARYAVKLENCVLTYRPNKPFAQPDATLRLKRATLDEINLHQTTVEEAMASGALTVEGNWQKVRELFSLLDTFEPTFNIVTP